MNYISRFRQLGLRWVKAHLFFSERDPIPKNDQLTVQ